MKSLYVLCCNLMHLGKDSFDRPLFKEANTNDYYCLVDLDATLDDVAQGKAELYTKDTRDGEPVAPVEVAGAITKAQLKKAQTTMQNAKDKFIQMATSYALQQCPFKIGDRTTVLGLAHRGKTMEVRHIRADFDWGRDLPIWKVTGPVLKADGTVSAYEAVVREPQYTRLMDDCGGDFEKYCKDLEL